MKIHYTTITHGSPWDEYDHPGKGKGKGHDHDHPVVPESSSYGAILFAIMLAVLIIRRFKRQE